MPAKLSKEQLRFIVPIVVGSAVGTAVAHGLYEAIPTWLAILIGSAVVVAVSLGIVGLIAFQRTMRRRFRFSLRRAFIAVVLLSLSAIGAALGISRLSNQLIHPAELIAWMAFVLGCWHAAEQTLFPRNDS